MPPRATDIEPIVDRIRPLLAGHSPDIQGAVLADLLAIWLAGHRICGMGVETDALRDRLLHLHIETVRQLIPVNAAMIHGEAEE